MTRSALLFVAMVLLAGLLPAAASARTTPDSLIGPDIPISTLDNQKLLPAVPTTGSTTNTWWSGTTNGPATATSTPQRVGGDGRAAQLVCRLRRAARTGPCRPLPMTRSMTAIWSSGNLDDAGQWRRLGRLRAVHPRLRAGSRPG